jgi:SAM-dependent methyltransferase
MSASTCENLALPANIVCRQLLLNDIECTGDILDVGCGDGNMMVELADQGFSVTGVDIDPDSLRTCRERGLTVKEGIAEQLPFAAESFDGIICSVTIPLTDEVKAISEWARVLKPGGFVRATYHGLGYGPYYVMHGHNWRKRVLGLRMMFNTPVYRATGKRLPGFLGDSLCQTPNRLNAYYRQFGLTVEQEVIADRYCGFPRFFGHRLRKTR